MAQLFFTDTSGRGLESYDRYKDYNWNTPTQKQFGNAGVIGNASTGSIEALTQMVNEINQRAQKAGRETQTPGVSAADQTALANINADLENRFRPGIAEALRQQNQEFNVSSGNPLAPSGGLGTALIKFLYDQSNNATNRLAQLKASNPAAPIYDAGNQVLTAAQLQQAILAREEMANRLRMAQLGHGGGPGGVNIGRGTTPTVATSASNWLPVFGQDQTLPTPTAWTPTQNPAFSNEFVQSGGTWQPSYGTNPTLPFETDWNNVLFGGGGSIMPSAPIASELNNQDWQDFEDWFYGGGG